VGRVQPCWMQALSRKDRFADGFGLTKYYRNYVQYTRAIYKKWVTSPRQHVPDACRRIHHVSRGRKTQQTTEKQITTQETGNLNERPTTGNLNERQDNHPVTVLTLFTEIGYQPVAACTRRVSAYSPRIEKAEKIQQTTKKQITT